LEIVRELEEVNVEGAIHPRRRVVILLRGDGQFAFAEQYHYTSAYEGKVIAEGWATLSPEGIYASVEIAQAEGVGAFKTRHGLAT
jgi:hypothetical protein